MAMKFGSDIFGFIVRNLPKQLSFKLIFNCIPKLAIVWQCEKSIAISALN